MLTETKLQEKIISLPTLPSLPPFKKILVATQSLKKTVSYGLL